MSTDQPADGGAADRVLVRLSEAAALGGGAALLCAMAVLVVTVVGGAFNRPLLGDSELVELLCGIAVFAFLPWCQMRGANVIVDFFTQSAPQRLRDWLDALMGIVFTLVAGVLTWRLIDGGLSALARSKKSMFLQLPEWWGYAVGAAAMLLWVLVCAWTAYVKLRRAAAPARDR